MVNYHVEYTYTVVGNNGNILSASNHFLKDNNGKTRPMCEICSNLTTKTPE